MPDYVLFVLRALVRKIYADKVHFGDSIIYKRLPECVYICDLRIYILFLDRSFFVVSHVLLSFLLILGPTSFYLPVCC